MAEEVGSLKVSLALDSADFSKSMSSVDRNLKALGGELAIIRNKGADWGKSIDGLKTRQETLGRTLDTQEVKVRKLREAYEKSAAEKGKDAKETENLATKLNKAVAEYTRTETELSQVNAELVKQQAELKRSESSWNKFSESSNEAGKKLKSAGDKMKGVGDTLSVGLTAPIVGFGLAAGKAALDFDSAQGKIQAQLGVSAQEAEKLGDVAENLWQNAFGDSVGEVSDSLAIIRQNMQDLTDVELESVAEKAFILRDAFGAEINETTRTASVLMKNFQVDADTALDLVTTGFQRGGDFSGELLDTLREYAPQFKGMGYDAEEFTAILIAGAESGAFNLDKVGDAAKEAFLRIGDGSTASRDALEGLGLDVEQIETNINSGGESAKTAFAAVASAIATVEDPAERAQTAVALLGTPIEDLGPEFQTFFADVNTDLGNFEGATERAGEALYDNFGTRATTLWRDFQASMEPTGEIVLDMAEERLPKLSAGLETVSNWFANLSPEGQKAIVVLGAITAAIGPVIGGTAMLASGVGGAITTVSALSGAIAGAGGLTAALTVLTGPVGLGIAAVAGLTVGAIALSNEMSESSIQVEGFGDKVSESTQKAVGAFLELDEQATVALNQLSWSQQTVTAEMAEQLIGTFGQMNEQILAEMQTDHEEQLAATQSFFDRSNTLTAEEEAKIVGKVQQSQEEQQAKVTEGQDRIAEILTTAAEEKREITDQERQEINGIQEEMKETAVRVMSESEAEQKAILESLKSEASKISAEQAAEVVKNSVEQKDKVVAEAEDQYKSAVTEIIRMRDESGVISEEQADKLIKEAQRQRDDTVSAAEETHENVIKEAKAQAEGHVNQVDWETGEVLSKWQVFKNNTSSNWNEMIENARANWDEMGTNIRNRAEEIRSNAVAKFNQLRDDARTKFEETKENMLRPVREAKEDIGNLIDDVKGFFTNLKLKFPKIEMPALPRFSLEGNFSLNPPSVPRLNVDWYANGGFFDKPSVIGIGEAGKEAAVPLVGRRMDPFADAVFNRLEERLGNGANGGQGTTITQNLHFHGDGIPSPSETARKQRQASRQLAMEWGV